MKLFETDFGRDVSLLWDRGDAWGSTMELLFAIADELTGRGAELPEAYPDEWRYRSNGNGPDPESLAAEFAAEASTEDLQRFGRVLWRARRMLVSAGRDY